ncbi:helix-turn-helix domain-containing protein [Actinomadura rayongensis]|uniref:PucR family transcriptional regulator n=1 Tax=Actinomadura rayongensis TaxID=1429076 RepID=A0A6I4W3K6_9ACTN|nr:PucR family transcriptional regulator [Actinomadura rayongensis]MXQ64013.1 PucR family transcriptional regulator [Actinomadura rayongensis]
MSHSPVEPGPPVLRLASTGTLTPGLSVAEVLGVPSLAGARLAAGRAGLGRVVRRLNVLDAPDVRVKPDELLLASGRVLRAVRLADLAARGLAALAVRAGRPGEAPPARLIAEADRLGVPLILLPAGTGFDEVLNQVLTGILNRQAAVLARTEEVHRALVQIVLCGGGVQEVVAEVAAVLGVPVALLDGDGRVLARAGRPDLAAAPPGSPAVPVLAGGFDHGRIVAHGALGDTDLGILERAATVAALVVTKQQAVAAVESKYRADFLRDVLAGRAGDDDQITAHCAGFGWDLDRRLAVVVAELDARPDGTTQTRADERAAQDRLTAAWTAAARRRDPGAAVASFAHEVVALVGTDQGVDEDAAALAAALAAEAAAQFTEQGTTARTFSTGVSRTVAGPSGLPEAYEQAGTAVRVGRRLHGPGARAHFDGLGVYRLLSLVPDPAELHAFVRETLGDLAAGDDPEMEDLRRTLQELLETNLNVAETARRLHFHYNTLRYRIGKLERMLGPFTRDANLRLNLTLALHVLRMRGI